uniref:cDNA FLJ27040 fis, clone SLV08542 n=1 Tax=Homo sapiens TaxID=9606 RepID=Q6ZNV9_HUMAN|nr:unnamed protein product [Homo sapiens]
MVMKALFDLAPPLYPCTLPLLTVPRYSGLCAMSQIGCFSRLFPSLRPLPGVLWLPRAPSSHSTLMDFCILQGLPRAPPILSRKSLTLAFKALVTSSQYIFNCMFTSFILSAKNVLRLGTMAPHR